MDIDDKELFSSAMTADEIPEVADTPAEAPVTETPQQEDRPRDEHGRFARQTEPEPQPAQQAEQPAAKEEANVPSWRLREVREEAERRVAEANAQWQRQFEMLQRQNAPKPEPTPAPDLFEDPDGRIDHRFTTKMTPYEQRLAAMEAKVQEDREANSRYFAEKDHGPETVREAYNWLAQGIQARDPNVLHLYQQVMQSTHPFNVIVQAHRELSLVQQIKAAGGPEKWREQQLAAGQPQSQGSNSRQASRNPQGSIVKLPPSLKNVASSHLNDDGDDDSSDAAMFRHAMR
jgi:hypothetical protein